MEARDIALFNDSLERCSATPGFLARFYSLFLASSDTVAEKFEHTDLRRQAKMLKSSLYIMMLACNESERALHLEKLASHHGKAGLAIAPALCDLWLDQLMGAVEEFDPRFDLQAGAAWQRLLQPSIEFMKSSY